MVKLTPAELAQSPERVGRRENIVIKGKKRITRTYMPNQNDWSYTALGRDFYKQARVSYVVHAPVWQNGINSYNRAYRRENTFPLRQPIELPLALSQEQRDDRIKAAVIEQYGGGQIAEYSGETVTLRPEGMWTISENKTTPTAGGVPETEIVEREL
jgi:hypothetical protein